MLLADVIRSLFRKPVTTRYPFKKEPVPERLRGRVTWDSRKCIRCLTCIRVCPTGACQFQRVGKGKIGIDQDLCSLCYQCVTNCPTGALTGTREFELVRVPKKKLK
ncbi:MAG: 4Fe-4S binding protein [Candidatus Aenigmatarchaeota archaeon]